MKQREIWFANLDPTQGSEQAGLRPVVIISGNMMNQKQVFVSLALFLQKSSVSLPLLLSVKISKMV